MFKFIKRFFGLDYGDNTAAKKHSGVGYSGTPALDPIATDFMGITNVAERSSTRPAVEGKGELSAVKKAPKKPAAKKAAPKKAAPKKTAK